MSDRIKTSSQDKRETVETFMAIGMVMLHLDARVPGVRVPVRLQNDFQLRLNVSPRFHPCDLEIDSWGIRQTLTFGGTPFPVAVPWVAIYGLSNALGEMRLYPHAMPDELFEAIELSQGKTGEELKEEMRTRKRDDGKSPTPVLSFRPSGVASGKSGDHPSPRPQMTSPGPMMMRRKGGLALVPPPSEDDEATSVAEDGTNLPFDDGNSISESSAEASKIAVEEKKSKTPRKSVSSARKKSVLAVDDGDNGMESKAKSKSSKTVKKTSELVAKSVDEETDEQNVESPDDVKKSSKKSRKRSAETSETAGSKRKKSSAKSIKSTSEKSDSPEKNLQPDGDEVEPSTPPKRKFTLRLVK